MSPHPSPSPISFAKHALIATLTLGCGGSSLPNPAPPEAPLATQQSAEAREEVSMSAEMGALNERETHSSFYNAMDGLQDCVAEGSRRLEYLSGAIELAVLVDSTPRAVRVWATHSTLGDRATEQCMFTALTQVNWPTPVGGPISIAENRFEFPLPKGVSAPTVWDAGRATSALEPLRESLASCREGNDGKLLATLYIDTTGAVISSGASNEREVPDRAVACVLEVLGEAQFPPFENSTVKLRIRL